MGLLTFRGSPTVRLVGPPNSMSFNKLGDFSNIVNSFSVFEFNRTSKIREKLSRPVDRGFSGDLRSGLLSTV